MPSVARNCERGPTSPGSPGWRSGDAGTGVTCRTTISSSPPFPTTWTDRSARTGPSARWPARRARRPPVTPPDPAMTAHLVARELSGMSAPRGMLIPEMSGRASSPVLVGRAEQMAALEAAFVSVRQGGLSAVLRDLVHEMGADAVASMLPGRTTRGLARLLPELGEPDTSGDPAEARARLFEEVLSALDHLTRHSPVVLVIEDAHWADRSSRDLLTFLIGNQRALSGLLVVVTFRSDELHRTHPLRPLLASLDRIAWVERVDLPRLTRHDTGELVVRILGRQPAGDLADALYHRSEGNPLFVEALLCCDGELSAERPAVIANVLHPRGDGYAFRHELIREAVHEDLLPGEHGRMHSRFAEAIDADPALVPPGRAAIEMAHHWHSAHDSAWALTSAWQAAAQAGRAVAAAERLSLLARVLELWDQVPDAVERIGAGHTQVLEEAISAARDAAEFERGIALV